MHPSSVYNKNDNPHFVCNIDTVDAWISTLREDDTCEMNINPDCLKIANKVWKEVKK